ncbi:MAG: riboflavin synthase [Polyangia bacterium]|jgi:riboflavin synthase|nr:riboflavin synthase [Polyangia bacterium]
MFTGLIEDVGRIRRVQPGDRSTTFTVLTKLCKESFRLGDSLAVNGACLTVVEEDQETVSVTAVSETLGRTNLAALVAGSKVNLERPLRLGDRLDGHLVQGHVDATGRVEDVRPDGDAFRLSLSYPPELEAFLVPKGSVAVDGVSLTVAAVSPGRFEVSVVPHTWRNTTLPERRRGALVNLEMDIIGKYVARMLGAHDGASHGLSARKLAEHGFF